MQNFNWSKDPKVPGFWYMASPYTKYRAGRSAAFREALMAAAALGERGVRVFSPIVNSHPIAGMQSPKINTYATWLPLDKEIAEGAYGLIVLGLPGWQESYGVGEEIKWFKAWGRPIRFLSWPVAGAREDRYIRGAFYWARFPAEMQSIDDDEWQVVRYYGDDVWHVPYSAVAYPTFMFVEIGPRVERTYMRRSSRPEPSVAVRWWGAPDAEPLPSGDAAFREGTADDEAGLDTRGGA